MKRKAAGEFDWRKDPVLFPSTIKLSNVEIYKCALLKADRNTVHIIYF